jgi:hypothetical protein
MSAYTTNNTNTQNELLMKKLMEFYTLPYKVDNYSSFYYDNPYFTSTEVKNREFPNSEFDENKISNNHLSNQTDEICVEENTTDIISHKKIPNVYTTKLVACDEIPENKLLLQSEDEIKNIFVDNITFQKISQNLIKMMRIINGDEKISLRIVDWFVTNYAKKYYTVYDIVKKNEIHRFKVYNDYKLKLKAYSKRRFDVFCRWERIKINYDVNKYMETTIGQLNFFKWAIENDIIKYISENYKIIEDDMNERNNSKKNNSNSSVESNGNSKTRKKREELSVSACKSIKKEFVNIVVKFN